MDDKTNYYEEFCSKRLDKHEVKIDELMYTVKNGLSHRVKRIDRLLWLVATVVIGKVVIDLFL